MILQHIIYLPAIIGLSVIGVLVGYSNSRSRLNRAFVLFVGGIIIWLTASYIADSGVIFDALTAIRIIYATAALLPLLLAYFIINFLARNKKDIIKKSARVYLVFLIAISMFFVVISMSSLTVQEARHGPIGVEVVKAGNFLFLHVIYYLLTTIIAFAILVLRHRKTSQEEKKQIGLLIWGLTAMVIINLFVNGILVVLGTSELGPILGVPSVILFVLLVQFSIFKHRLFDVRLIIARSIAYLLSIGTISLVFGIVVIGVAVNLLGATRFNVAQQIFIIASALFLGLIFPPLKKFFDKVTNKLFYRDAYDPQLFLDEINRLFVSTIEMEPLLRQSASIIESNLKTEFCLIAVKETDTTDRKIIGTVMPKFSERDIEYVRSKTPHIHQKVILADDLGTEHADLKRVLTKNGISVLGRLVTDTVHTVEGTGYLILGPKKSGGPFNSQDIRIIEIIVNELLIAIQNALRFEEIQAFNATLQEKINDATRRLRSTNEKLKVLDETKDEFISMASHQLRTPLTSVKGYLSMVLEGDTGKVTPAQRKLLDQAFISSQRMVYLIADLLNVSRLKTGKFILETTPTNLADVVEGEMNQLQETAQGRGLELIYEKPKDFPTLVLDETKIRQVIMNFADNAIYYTPAGGHIKVTLKETAETIEFKVVDDGIGVPKSEQHHLFSKFYRAGNARKARPDGTGLGLFMAKKVIVVQGGSLIFKSEEGKGSTFGFVFPKAKLLPK